MSASSAKLCFSTLPQSRKVSIEKVSTESFSPVVSTHFSPVQGHYSSMVSQDSFFALSPKRGKVSLYNFEKQTTLKGDIPGSLYDVVVLPSGSSPDSGLLICSCTGESPYDAGRIVLFNYNITLKVIELWLTISLQFQGVPRLTSHGQTLFVACSDLLISFSLSELKEAFPDPKSSMNYFKDSEVCGSNRVEVPDMDVVLGFSATLELLLLATTEAIHVFNPATLALVGTHSDRIDSAAWIQSDLIIYISDEDVYELPVIFDSPDDVTFGQVSKSLILPATPENQKPWSLKTSISSPFFVISNSIYIIIIHLNSNIPDSYYMFKTMTNQRISTCHPTTVMANSAKPGEYVMYSWYGHPAPQKPDVKYHVARLRFVYEVERCEEEVKKMDVEEGEILEEKVSEETKISPFPPVSTPLSLYDSSPFAQPLSSASPLFSQPNVLEKVHEEEEKREEKVDKSGEKGGEEMEEKGHEVEEEKEEESVVDECLGFVVTRKDIVETLPVADVILPFEEVKKVAQKEEIKPIKFDSEPVIAPRKTVPLTLFSPELEGPTPLTPLPNPINPMDTPSDQATFVPEETTEEVVKKPKKKKQKGGKVEDSPPLVSPIEPIIGENLDQNIDSVIVQQVVAQVTPVIVNAVKEAIFTKIDGKFSSLLTQISSKMDLNTIKKSVTEVKSSLGETNQALKKLPSKFQLDPAAVNTISQRLGQTVQSSITNAFEHSVVPAVVSTVESSLAPTVKAVDSVSRKVGTVDSSGDLKKLQEKIGTLSNQVIGLGQQISKFVKTQSSSGQKQSELIDHISTKLDDLSLQLSRVSLQQSHDVILPVLINHFNERQFDSVLSILNDCEPVQAINLIENLMENFKLTPKKLVLAFSEPTLIAEFSNILAKILAFDPENDRISKLAFNTVNILAFNQNLSSEQIQSILIGLRDTVMEISNQNVDIIKKSLEDVF
ncbi:hypothetical protein RCL1_008019 [Eukaryota sp. TZLM3-RCL]